MPPEHVQLVMLQLRLTVPACQEALPTSWYCTSLSGGPPSELVLYQPVGRASQRAGTVPACREGLPASWYCTSLLGGPPNELVLYQLVGSTSQRAGTVPVRWEKVSDVSIREYHHTLDSNFAPIER